MPLGISRPRLSAYEQKVFDGIIRRRQQPVNQNVHATPQPVRPLQPVSSPQPQTVGGVAAPTDPGFNITPRPGVAAQMGLPVATDPRFGINPSQPAPVRSSQTVGGVQRLSGPLGLQHGPTAVPGLVQGAMDDRLGRELEATRQRMIAQGRAGFGPSPTTAPAPPPMVTPIDPGTRTRQRINEQASTASTASQPPGGAPYNPYAPSFHDIHAEYQRRADAGKFPGLREEIDAIAGGELDAFAAQHPTAQQFGSELAQWGLYPKRAHIKADPNNPAINSFPSSPSGNARPDPSRVQAANERLAQTQRVGETPEQFRQRMSGEGEAIASGANYNQPYIAPPRSLRADAVAERRAALEARRTRQRDFLKTNFGVDRPDLPLSEVARHALSARRRAPSKPQREGQVFVRTPEGQMLVSQSTAANMAESEQLDMPVAVQFEYVDALGKDKADLLMAHSDGQIVTLADGANYRVNRRLNSLTPIVPDLTTGGWQPRDKFLQDVAKRDKFIKRDLDKILAQRNALNYEALSGDGMVTDDEAAEIDSTLNTSLNRLASDVLKNAGSTFAQPPGDNAEDFARSTYKDDDGDVWVMGANGDWRLAKRAGNGKPAKLTGKPADLRNVLLRVSDPAQYIEDNGIESADLLALISDPALTYDEVRALDNKFPKGALEGTPEVRDAIWSRLEEFEIEQGLIPGQQEEASAALAPAPTSALRPLTGEEMFNLPLERIAGGYQVTDPDDPNVKIPVPSPTDREAYMALPVGALYVDPLGNKRVKGEPEPGQEIADE